MPGEPIVVGFTGTQRGMTLRQVENVGKVLKTLRAQGACRLHHGDCVGADMQAHALALATGYEVELHPPSNPRKRAFCRGAVIARAPLPYLKRNDAIVAAADVLVATPNLAEDDPRSLRSGTWATVRRARKRGLLIVYCWPSGLIEREGEPLPQPELLS